MKETIRRRVIDPETRDRWISITYMIVTCAMLLHHVWITIYFPFPENGAIVFRYPWVILAAVSFFLGRMWKDKGFWILAMLLVLKFLRVAIPMPDKLSDTQTVYELCLYAYAICYPVGRVLNPEDRRHFVSIFCALWTAATTVLACIGLYAVWNNAAIHNLGTKAIYVGDFRLWLIYHPVEGSCIAGIGVAVAMVGFSLVKRKILKFLYLAAVILILLMGDFCNSRTGNIQIAIGLSTAICLMVYEWWNHGVHSKPQAALRIAGICVLFIALTLGLIVLQLQVIPAFNAIRGQGGPLISTAYAEGAPNGTAQIYARGFVTDQGLNGLLTGRVHTWETTLKAMTDNPVLFLTGQSVYRFMVPLDAYGLGWLYHLHSTFVQTLWENGIPGLLLFAGFFCIFAVNAFRLITDRSAPMWERLIPIPAALCWMADLQDCMGYCNWGKPPMTILYFFSGLSIAIALERRKKERNTDA